MFCRMDLRVRRARARARREESGERTENQNADCARDGGGRPRVWVLLRGWAFVVCVCALSVCVYLWILLPVSVLSTCGPASERESGERRERGKNEANDRRHAHGRHHRSNRWVFVSFFSFSCSFQ